MSRLGIPLSRLGKSGQVLAFFFFFFVGGGGGGQAFRMLDVEDYMIESRWRAPGAA